MSVLKREWAEILAGLDRQVGRRHGSPDRAGLAELMGMYRVPGMSIAVEREDARWAGGFGRTAADQETEVTPRTAFQACSISKQVAAFGTLRLVGDGVVDLDEDIRAYLTSWRLPECDGWRVVLTVRQLLGHTAGLSYNWFRGFGAGQPEPTLRQVLDGQRPANTPPVRVSMLPGSRFRYSGSHYAVLQQVLVDVTGVPFAELIRTLVLEPVGMAGSGYVPTFPNATGHHVDGTPLAGRWRVQPELAGAGLWTTPTDLARLGGEIALAVRGQSTLLSGELAGQLLTVQVPGGDYGLGSQVDEVNGCLRFGHTGRNVGFSCWSFTWLGSPATSVAVMANLDECDELLSSILSAAERRYAVPAERPSGPLTGVYQLRDGYPLEIDTAGDGLILRVPGQPPIPLRPLAGGRYLAGGLDCEITFQCQEGVPALEISQEGHRQTAIRQPGVTS